MNYLQRKKLAFMSIANRVKGFIRAVSGVPPLVLTDCSDGDSLINYRVYGQSVQDGVPSQDNPAEVQCVGDYDESCGKYKIPVIARGRNLLDKDNANITPLYYNGGKYASGVAIKTFYLTCEAGKQYSITCSPKGGRLTVSFCTYFPLVSRDAFGYATDAAFTSITVTAPPAAEYMLVEFYNGNKCESGFTYEDALKYIMVEQGEATEYEPYHAPVTTNIYLDEPLRKIADYIDFEGGKAVRYTASGEPVEEAISLPKLPTFKGTTIYEVGTTINPSGMDVEYYSSLKGE